MQFSVAGLLRAFSMLIHSFIHSNTLLEHVPCACQVPRAGEEG